MSAMKSLSNISEIRIGLQHFTQVKPMISGSFRPYAQILNLAWMVASNLDMFDLYGEDVQSSPLLSVQKPSQNNGLQWDLIDMPELFERYLRHVTNGQKRTLPLNVEHSSEKWVFKDRTIEPDCVVEGTTATVVLDAKYKRMFEEAQVSSQAHREGAVLRMVEWSTFTEEQEKVNQPASSSNTRKPNLGDQYQVVAYATHRDIRTAHAGLVYPSNGQGEDASPQMLNLGYSTTSMHGVTVQFLPLRIDLEGIRDEFQRGHFLNNLQACLHDTGADDENE
jgi:5-methylcytosine-specific restriction endonuclease McrBC regulatory subunit McrC